MAIEQHDSQRPEDHQTRQRRPLTALLIADGISQTGNMLTMLAIPWFVLETTGSAARTGLTAAVEALAIVVAGFFGGALVDRLGHKRTSIAGDLASAATVALIPLLHHTIGLAFWQLLVLVFLGALLDTPGWSARRSLYEVVARLGNVSLDRANTGAQMANRVAGLAGPLLAGLLVATLGATDVLWIDAVTFLVSAGLVAVGIPARTVSSRPAIATRSGGYLEEVKEGLRFIRGDRLIFWLIVAFGLGSMLAEPVYTVILPVYANTVFGSSVDLGVMFAGLAIGSLIGNLIFLWQAPRLPRRATIITGFSVRVLTFWVLVTMPSVGIIAGAIAVNAIFLEPTNPISATIMQERVPEALRGRVFGASLALSYAARSIGVLVYGLLLEWFGLRETLIVLSIVNVIVPITLTRVPGLGTIPATPQQQMRSAARA